VERFKKAIGTAATMDAQAGFDDRWDRAKSLEGARRSCQGNWKDVAE
jgi:hypothetical protein